MFDNAQYLNSSNHNSHYSYSTHTPHEHKPKVMDFLKDEKFSATYPELKPLQLHLQHNRVVT